MGTGKDKRHREGDSQCINILDEALRTIGHFTRKEYVPVDDPKNAHIEVYVGHDGHPRVLEMHGPGCNDGPGCASNRSTRGNEAIDRAFVTVHRRLPEWRDESITLEEEIRYTTIHEMLHALIPVGHDNRPFNQLTLDRPEYIRRVDVQMYEMIYSPLVSAGMTLDEMRELVVLDEETLDYDGTPIIEPNLLLQKTMQSLKRSEAMTVEMVGSWQCGFDRTTGGPKVTVTCWDGFGDNNVLNFELTHEGTVVLGLQDETELWHTNGGESTLLDDDAILRELGFEPYWSDPLLILLLGIRYTDEIIVYDDGPDQDYRVHGGHLRDSNGNKMSIVLTVDRDSGELSTYAFEWDFDESAGCEYHFSAVVQEFGTIPEIPAQIQEESFLLNPERAAQILLEETITGLTGVLSELGTYSADVFLLSRCGDATRSEVVNVELSLFAASDAGYEYSVHRFGDDLVLINDVGEYFIHDGSMWQRVSGATGEDYGVQAVDENFRLLTLDLETLLTQFEGATDARVTEREHFDSDLGQYVTRNDLYLANISFSGFPPLSFSVRHNPADFAIDYAVIAVAGGGFALQDCRVSVVRQDLAAVQMATP